MDQDNLMVALWKIKGVKKVLDAIQVSFNYKDDQDLFFILSNELHEALSLISTEQTEKIE